MKHQISEHCADAVVELCFLAVPCMSPEDLAPFLRALFTIIERERREAVEQERRRWQRTNRQ